jgi:opacity protein-like surface antigen
MRLKSSATGQAAMILGASLLLLSMSAVAQERRSEFSMQGTGFFTRNSDGNGIHNETTNAGGFLAGYRYNINRWLAGEANYGYSRNTQVFSGLVPARVQSNVHEVTGAAVVKLPTFDLLFHPFLLGGGGVLVFDPTNNQGGTLVRASQETRGTFLHGGGIDCPFSRNLALRVEYRGFVYKVADFNVAGLNTDSWTHVAQPSAGFVFKF